MISDMECPGSCPLCGSRLMFSSFDITSTLRGEDTALATLFCTNRLCLGEIRARGINISTLRESYAKAYRKSVERARENIGGFQFVD